MLQPHCDCDQTNVSIGGHSRHMVSQMSDDRPLLFWLVTWCQPFSGHAWIVLEQRLWLFLRAMTCDRLLAGTLTGEFLMPQILYEGKTNRCHPKSSAPVAGMCGTARPIGPMRRPWSATCSRLIVVPFLDAKRKELNLVSSHPALAIFDCFKGQTILLNSCRYLKNITSYLFKSRQLHWSTTASWCLC